MGERIEAEIEEVEIDRDDGSGLTTSGVQATCTECGHVTESFGTGDGSVRRCLALLREECPRNENNFYVADNE